MKKFVFIILVLTLAVCLAACGKKQEPLEEMQEPISLEELSAINMTSPVAGEAKLPPTPIVAPTLEPSLPTVNKPTNQEIQTALKNAGYYTGEIDGKIGPLSKKAIKEFQAANGLEADGKVGPKTWAVLGNYLNPQALPEAKKKR